MEDKKKNSRTKQPKVTIIITTHGRTDFLRNAVLSVLQQDYNEIEIIVVDDNADNPSIRKNVKEIMSEFPRCKVIFNPENLGGSLSRNVGIKASSGEFVSFLDDDDTYRFDRITRNVQCYFNLNNKNIGLIYSYCAVVDSKGSRIGGYHTDLGDNPLYQHMLTCLAATSQWFCPRNVLFDVGLFENTPCKQDSIMLLKILAKGYEVHCIPEELSNFTEHNSGRISGISEKNVVGLCNFHDWCKRFYNRLTENQIHNVEEKFTRDLLTLYVLLGNRKEASKCLKSLGKLAFPSKVFFVGLFKYIIGKNYIKLARGLKV